MSENNSGVDKSFIHTTTGTNAQEAERLCRRGMDRLLDVNNWHHYAGEGSAVFQRMDENGLALTGMVQPTDFIRIELPGPRIGRGFDWVAVEELHSGDCRTRLIVRPCADPTSAENTTAHFLNNEATSTFEVELEGLQVFARIFGKNEKPNDESKGLLQKTRDFLVGLGAIAGASDTQWNRLVKGFLADSAD